jgi:hypothetical protein
MRDFHGLQGWSVVGVTICGRQFATTAAAQEPGARQTIWGLRPMWLCRGSARGLSWDTICRVVAHRVDSLRCEGSDAIGAKRTCRERRERVDLTKMTRSVPKPG